MESPENATDAPVHVVVQNSLPDCLDSILLSIDDDEEVIFKKHVGLQALEIVVRKGGKPFLPDDEIDMLETTRMVSLQEAEQANLRLIPMELERMIYEIRKAF